MNYLEHQRQMDCGDPDCSSCIVCDCFVCEVCGLFEGGLTTHCPGEAAFDKSAAVFAGKLDFVNGQWVGD